MEEYHHAKLFAIVGTAKGVTTGCGFCCNRLIYKRGCQEHFSPSAGCAGLFRDIQPLSPAKSLV
jgi:hypothetical protein